jgi:hypothetical protein
VEILKGVGGLAILFHLYYVNLFHQFIFITRTGACTQGVGGVAISFYLCIIS